MITTDQLVSKIEKEAPKIRLRSQHLGIDTEVRIVESDLPLRDHEVIPYAAERIEVADKRRQEQDRQRLFGIERDGKILRWSRGKRLTYCVLRSTFGNDQEHAALVADMATATADWSGICGVAFEHAASKDRDPGFQLGDVDFPVIRQSQGGSLIALAFFPDAPVTDKVVHIFDGYFNPGSFAPVGVLRHELGHVLGFRHEHIRPEAPDLFSPESLEHTLSITQYDSKSVMHYVMNGVGDPQLRFTELDKVGARRVYGGSDLEFSFVE
jgi:hypothetical protein